jgi:hypothetical protein
MSLTGSIERRDSVRIEAGSVRGSFFPTLGIAGRQYRRFTLDIDRPPSLWLLGTELDAHFQVASSFTSEANIVPSGSVTRNVRLSLRAHIERPIASHRLVLHTLAALSTNAYPLEDLVYFGGPSSAPGYDYHTLWGGSGVSQRVEWRAPAPFIPFSLGRFGRVPGRGSIAPFATLAHVGGALDCVRLVDDERSKPPVPKRPHIGCIDRDSRAYPSIGIGYLTPFDLIRFDVARGLRDGRWAFYVDVSREFWRIL